MLTFVSIVPPLIVMAIFGLLMLLLIAELKFYEETNGNRTIYKALPQIFQLEDIIISLLIEIKLNGLLLTTMG